MPILRNVPWTLLALAVSASFVSAAEIANSDAVLWNDHLVLLKSDSSFGAWLVPTVVRDARVADSLKRSGIIHLEADGSQLWAATDATLYERAADGSEWRKKADFTKRDDSLLAVIAVGGSPLLIYPTVVVDPIRPREFPVPTSTGQVRTNVLRMRAAYGTGTELWIGTGYGEWGGSLWRLEPASGTWSESYDGLHYVTGITSASTQQVLVAWSMSHFYADTLIRAHGRDAKAAMEWPEQKQKYYQRIAFSRFDRELYGIENRTLVRISSGRSNEIVELTGSIFERESHAIGVAPGIRALIPVAANLIVVVPNAGPLLLVNVGQRTMKSLN